MYRVVRVVVAQVADDEEAKERLDPWVRDNKREEQIDKADDKNGTCGRHHEARAIIRVIVMNAVKKVDEIATRRGRWTKMKHEPVDEIFTERPCERASHQHRAHIGEAKSMRQHTSTDQPEGNRPPQAQRHNGMHMSERFQKTVLKEADAF